jgi:hypothetical protein
MSEQNPQLVMMRFDPKTGWVKPSEEHTEMYFDEVKKASINIQDAPHFSVTKTPTSENIAELGASIVQVFNSLKLEDPRLEIWDQVNATIEKIAAKVNEKKLLEQQLYEVGIDIENLSNLASEFVSHAYQNELEIHATSKVRLQIAESVHHRLKNALKS